MWVIAETRDGLDFVHESSVKPKVLMKSRGFIAGHTGEPVLVEWLVVSKVDECVEKQRPVESTGGKADKECDDARILPLEKNAIGELHRDWRDLAISLGDVEFKHWPIGGARVTSWAVFFLRRKAYMGPGHHRWWVQICGLLPTYFGVQEHESCLWVRSCPTVRRARRSSDRSWPLSGSIGRDVRIAVGPQLPRRLRCPGLRQ